MQPGITTRSLLGTEEISVFAKFYVAYNSMTALWLAVICPSISRWNTASKKVHGKIQTLKKLITSAQYLEIRHSLPILKDNYTVITCQILTKALAKFKKPS